MKKVIVILTILLCITGCGLSSDKDKYTKTIDISYEKYLKKIENKDEFVLLLWQTGCSHCETFEPKLEEVIREYNVKIYSINLANLTNVEYAKIKNKTFINGTPTTVYIKNGVTDVNKIIGDKDEDSIVKFLKNINYIKE